MRKQYSFAGAIKNPYADRLKRPVTIRLDTPVIDYFKTLAKEMDMPYQTLINFYLRDCAITGRRPSVHWKKPPR